MKFGISQNIHDTTRSKPYDLLLDDLREVAEFADENGFDTFWLPEHHFSLWGREMMPNPLMVAADVAARTKRIRIGLSAAIITLWHPIRLAEDLAMLDQLSGGRLEIGFGRGNYGLETTNLNPIADPNNQEQNFKVFEEGVDVVITALANKIFSYKGEIYQFPAPGFKADRAHSVDDPAFTDPTTGELAKLTLIPGCKQKPTPPLWQVVSESPRSMRYAAKQNMGMIMWRPSVATLKQRLGIYKDAYREYHGVDLPFGAKTAIVRDTYVAESEKEARRLAEAPLIGSLNFANWRGPSIYLDPGETLDADAEAALRKELTYDFVRDRALFFGSPDDVVGRIQHLYEETRMEQITFKCSWPGLSHADEMRGMKLLAQEVLPRVRQWHSQRFAQAAE
ncbi:alkanesulfonate monooxygenase SsuD/methylene tetrahydromethanopterin reductase-like flavin-dependent oxidoreductase (luciferase family) [Rhodoligotrophos appendicifer]|uniref:LLM class flavin-dependent oxidoreductase n=1 Tax=Rhodoligotrophos appendicifer TaxID=987056 RepID=UPI001186AECE|nr:LLM class flavin-dependent oxidoreductase [Rhodoligotrophos appendicifer]